jgi:predicted dienelactone hydrolase
MNIIKIFKRLFKIFFYGVLTIIAIIGISLFAFWLELKFAVTLPAPTGDFAVGRTTFHWVDSSRTDSLSPKPYSKRELMVWMWYPAAKTNSDAIVDYLPAEWEEALNEQASFVLKYFWGRDGKRIHAHSIGHAQLSNKQAKYPIILMKSGIGRMAIDYTTLAEELASHGYIVVGSDAPYSTWLVRFPDGRIVKRTAEGNPGESEYFSEYRKRVLNRLIGIWSDDARFVLNKLEQLNTDSSNQFGGRLDIQTVGVFGHSFGGATAAQFCLDDPRCKAGVDVDGAPYGSVIQKKLDKPFMFLLAEHSDESDSVSMQIKSNIETIYNSAPDEHIWISLRGAKHFNFSDTPFQNEFLVSRIFGATGSIGGRRGLEVASACLRTFFDEHLKGQSPSSIRELPNKYPEVSFEK